MSWLKLNKEGPPEHQGVSLKIAKSRNEAPTAFLSLKNSTKTTPKQQGVSWLWFVGERVAWLSVCISHTQINERGSIWPEAKIMQIDNVHFRKVDIGINFQVNMSEISSVDINWKMLTLVRPGSKTDEQFFTKWGSWIFWTNYNPTPIIAWSIFDNFLATFGFLVWPDELWAESYFGSAENTKLINHNHIHLLM